VKRWVAAALAAVAVLALSACDPYAPSDTKNGVLLDITINTDGSGTAPMYLDDTIRSNAQLQKWGEAVGSRLFPSAASSTVRVDQNGGGYPFVVIEAQGIYQPGAQPQVSIDTRGAVTWLLSNGAKTVDVYIYPPAVPLTSTWTPARAADEGTWAWTKITVGTAAPFGVIVLSPKPWLGILPVVLTMLAFGLLLGSVVVFGRRRRRPLAMGMAGGALIVSVIVVIQSAAIFPENLGVAGILSSFWVEVASVVPLVTLLTAPTAVVLFVVFAVIGPPRHPIAVLR